MLEGLYSAAAGMAAQQERLDALSNDVANANTAGYKSVRVGFRDLVYQPDGPGGVATGAGAAATTIGRSFEEGSMQQTGQPFDLAINGEGYFQVQLPSGQLALTRQGSLSPDVTGQLVTPTGARLVPPVRVPRGTPGSAVQIAANGTVTASGRRVGRIQLLTVASPTGLQAIGDNNYSVTAQSGPARPAAGATLQQGTLESSDVDLTDTMTDMLDTQRSYSMTSKAIQMQDQMMQIANQVKQ